MEFIQIEVKERQGRGTAEMRRIRRQGMIPAVLYGLARRNLSLTIPAAELERFIRSGSHLVELTMGDETRDAILREVQQDPVTDEILHVDLQRVDKDAPVEDHVAVQFKGEAPGTKEGGLFQGLLDSLLVSARPRDLPEKIVLDVSALHVGDALFVRDVEVPERVEIRHEPEELVCHVVTMRGRDVEEEAAEGEEAIEAPEAAQPEAATPSEGGEG